MQPAPSTSLAPPSIPAMRQLSEKPRQGFETRKTARKPGPSSCNFKVTLGLRATVVGNGVRETYSARYYNPSTGRFLSRDPEDGKIKISATLHKYLYASGDPVNRIDPTGRADFVEVENVDNVSITMGHGARHLVGTGLSQAEAEAAIEQVVREDIAADGGIDCKSIGMVVLSGIPIIYRVYLVDAACLIVNVGTYFPL